MNDMSIEFLPLAMANPLAEMTKRAETAEARLKEWETAANNNDPYVTNGGYVEVEVLEAVKRRNSELLTRAEAAEAKLALAECVLHDYGIYVEGLALTHQVKALADRVVALEAEIKCRNAAENRMFDGLERLTNGRNPDSSEVWYER